MNRRKFLSALAGCVGAAAAASILKMLPKPNLGDGNAVVKANTSKTYYRTYTIGKDAVFYPGPWPTIPPLS